MIALLLVACVHPDAKPGDSAPLPDTSTPTDPTFTETLAPDLLHVLASGTPAPGDPGHGLSEFSVDLELRWSYDLPDGAGSAGAVRKADGDTVFVRAGLPPDYASALEEITPDGTVVWMEDEFFAGDFAFAHGLVMTPDGDWLIADTIMARVLAVDTAGEVLWELPFAADGESHLPNGLDIHTDGEGVTRIAVTELFRAGSETNDKVEVFRLGGRTDVPTREWTFAGASNSVGRLWPHGPRFLEDGSVLVNLAARGQVTRLVEGVQDWTVPPTAGVLAFPRDTLVLPDGTWLVADAGAEILRVFDPLGAFSVVDATPAPGVFALTRVDCPEAGGTPCLGG